MNKTVFSIIRKRLSNRPDSELEQSSIRIVILIFLMSYFYYFNESISKYKELFSICIAAITVASIFFIFTSLSKKLSVPRRIITVLLDMGTLSYMIYLSDDIGLPLIFIYLWITFGNGFRYGKKYLLISASLSILGFSVVMLHSEFWHDLKTLGVGVILAMIMLPLYLLFLISKLHAAVNEAKGANEAKSQFLANLSHEIRTPLNGVIGMSSLLAKTKLTSKQNDFASSINNSAKTLLALINDILDISKIEAGEMKPEFVEFDLYELINTSVFMFASQASEKKLELNTHVSPEIPASLIGNAKHLRQIIMNLIGNAVKFTGTGAIDIFVTPTIINKSSLTLKFEVIDTGIGIADEAKPIIFNTFSQADESITREYGGTGLGMAIAKQLVEMMGGHIGFDSQLGNGSNFWFEVTLDKSSSKPKLTDLLSKFNDKNVLILEKNERPSFFTKKIIEWNINFKKTSDIKEATSLINDLEKDDPPFNIFVINMNCPGLDPFQVIKKIKEHASYRIYGVILISNNDYNEIDKIQLLKAGYHSILDEKNNTEITFNALYSIIAGMESNWKNESFNDKSLINNRKLNILLAEDNETNQKVIANILNFAEHHVSISNNGDHALDILKDNDFDLIILDMQMPKMGGIETANTFRTLYPEKKDTPIMILTANATKEALDECIEAGIDAYLTKPVDADKLLNTVSVLVTKEQNLDMSKNMELDSIDNKTQIELKLLETDELDKINEMADETHFVKKLINNFIENTNTIISEMEAALAMQNYDHLTGLAHRLDGSSKTIGAIKLANTANNIYQCSKLMNKNETLDHIRELIEVFKETESSLMTYLGIIKRE